MALSVQNASVKSWTQGTGTLVLQSPTGNVTVTCQANINDYTLSIQTKLNGSNAQITGATSVRVYKSNTTTKPSSPTVTLTTNSSGYCSTSVTYLQYYWIEVYNYNGGSWTTLASAEQMPYNNVSKIANYYSVIATTGTYTSGASVSHSPVLSGTSVTFTATKGSATGYTYSDTITWTGTLTSFTSTSGQASAGKAITAQTTMDATCTRTANKYSLTIRSDNIRVTYGGTNYNDEAVINNITYGSSVSFSYTVLNSATYSGTNIKYNNNSTSQNYTKSGTIITFTMPAGNSVLFIGASTIDTEEDLLQVKYNTNTQLSYSASKYSLTNATSSVDGSVVFNLSTASNYWRVNASTVDENASGYSSVYLASTVGGVNFTSNFVLEQRKIEMYTYYTFTLSKGTGVASTSPASTIRVRRAAGSSASENTKTVTINPSTGYGRTYSHSLSPAGACTTSLSGNVLTISNATADATITFTSTKLQYTVTFYANGHGTAPSAYVGVEYGSKISEPTAPSALGYTFGGWYKESACTNAWNFSTDTVTSNRDLYAKWTAQNFTLTIRSEGITLRYNNTNYSNGSTVSIPAGTSVSMTYTLDDMYNFSGAEIWYNSSQHITCGNTGSAITFTMPTYATTLMAGGTSSEGVSASIRYNEAMSLTHYTTANFSLSNAMAEADGSLVYTITGTGTYWTVSASTASENTQGISTVKLKSGSYISTFALEELLVYMSTYYTVTITKGTGIASYTPTTTRMQRNSSTTLTVTYSTGYGRTLTATDSNNKCTLSTNASTKKVTISAVVGDCAITLASAKLQYTVSFVSSNTSYGTVSTASVANVDYGTVLSTSGNTCTCDGTTVTATPTTDTAQYDYEFSSWTNGTATITGNTTVTATFTRTLKTYTITPKVNIASYGTVTPNTAITGVPYGTTISSSGKTVTLTNGGTTIATITAQESTDTAQYDYEFTGWTNGTGTVTSSKNITANFSRTTKSYTVSFAMQGHGTQVSSQTISYGGKVTEPTAPVASGYTFGGWYKESGCTNAWNFSTDTITGTRTLYAKWTANTYSITVRSSYLTLSYNGQSYSNGSVISGIPTDTNVSMSYSLDEDCNFSGAEIWYNTTQHTTCTRSGTTLSFTMPAYNVVIMAGGWPSEEPGTYVSYNTAKSIGFTTAAYTMTNAFSPVDGSVVYTLTGTGTNWQVDASTNDEGAFGKSGVKMKYNNYVSTFTLGEYSITMYTTYTITVQSSNSTRGSVSPTSWSARKGSTFTVNSNTFSCGGRTCTATPNSPTAQYTFLFNQWTGIPENNILSANVTITGHFTYTTNKYTVTFTRNNSNYGTLSTYSVANVPYGTTLSTNGNTCSCNGTTITATPASQTAQYTYTFGSWTNGTATVQGNTTVTANFIATTRTYTVTVSPSPTSYSSSSTTTLTAIPYGASISTSGNTITVGSKSATMNPIANSGNYTYYLNYWSKSSGTITGDTAITAYFSKHEINVTISQGNMEYTNYEKFATVPKTVSYGSNASFTLNLSNYGNRKAVNNSSSNVIVGEVSGTPSHLVAGDDIQGTIIPWIRIDDIGDETFNIVYVAPSSNKPVGNKTVIIYDDYDSTVYGTIYLCFIPNSRNLYFTGSASSYPSTIYIGTAFTMRNIKASGTIGTNDTCIVEGTQITMANREQKSVEDVKPNDQILSYNPYTKEYCTATVIACDAVEETNDFYRIPFNGGYLDVTGRHGIWVKDEETYINFASIQNQGVDTLNTNGDTVHVEQPIEIHSETPVKSYKLITSLGLYYTNGILSVHRARNKYDVLGNLVQNLSDEVIEVFEQDYLEYSKFDQLKHTNAYQEAFERFRPMREYYNDIIFEEFNKLGVDIKAITPATPEGKKHYYRTMLEEYKKYEGVSKVLDEALAERIKLNIEWVDTQMELLGIPVVTRPELFKRCFLRDFAIEHLVKKEDFTFEE